MLICTARKSGTLCFVALDFNRQSAVHHREDLFHSRPARVSVCGGGSQRGGSQGGRPVRTSHPARDSAQTRRESGAQQGAVRTLHRAARGENVRRTRQGQSAQRTAQIGVSASVWLSSTGCDGVFRTLHCVVLKPIREGPLVIFPDFCSSCAVLPRHSFFTLVADFV